MQKFKLFLLLSITIGMVSCLPKPNELDSQDGDFCDSNFVIEEEVTGSLSTSDATALPEKFILQLTACIRPQGLIETKLASVDWAVSRNRKKMEDTIKEGENIKNTNTLKHHNTVIKRTADANGCIRWTEEFDYAYNQQSKWIILNRHIGGITNEYSGTCTIPLAVNPWLQLKKYLNIQVADYRKKFQLDNSVLEGRVEENGLEFLKQKKEAEKKNKVNLIVEEIALHTNGSTTLSKDNKKERILQGNSIKAKLKYIIKDIYGNLYSNNNIIKAGNFTIEPHLLIETSSMKPRKEENGEEVEIKEIEFIKMNKNNSAAIETLFEDGMLTSSDFNWEIPYENYTPRSIPVYLKVTPVGDTANRINEFEGIYYLGPNYQDVLSKNTHFLNLNAILAAKKYFEISNQSKEELSDSPSPDYIHPNQCFKKNESVLSCLSMDKSPLDEETGELRDGFGPAGWTAATMNLRFFQMKRENWLYREISTIAATTVSDPANSSAIISDTAITVQVTDLSSGVKARPEVIKTDSNGNISFNIYTKQQWYSRQRYFLKVIHLSSKTNELDIKKLVAINPWDYGFTHGFEVNHPKDIRTTCLTEEDKKAVSDLLEKNIDENNPLSSEKENGMSEIDFVHKIFCHIPSDYTDEEDPTDIHTAPEVHWTEIFNTFKDTLKDALGEETNLDPEKDFFTKFKSSKEGIKRPTAHIHLFRSINKYPTSLIDNSLTREIYYNVRFKLSPRVVRHDDIAIGQQNKGPLRDGVHIFQMAILKNDQGKYNGNENMVQSPEDFSQHVLNANKAGTVSLFSCPMEDPRCVKKEDFIMPPTNIPIFIREGIMKTDIRIPIKREFMLFANSKNLLVFRIQPADPASITCKNEHTDCTMRDSEFIDSYEANFDWNKTIKSIKPACSLDNNTTSACSALHEMFFYTYKTPIIPSLWANWNITHELDINFNNLANQYHLLQKNKDFNDRLHSLSRQASKSLEKYTEYQQEKNPTRNIEDNQDIVKSHEDIIFKLIELEEEVTNTGRQYSINNSINNSVREETLSQIETNLNDIEKQLQEYQLNIEQNTQMTREQKEAKLNRIAELLVELQAQAPSSAVAPKSPKEPENARELEKVEKTHMLRPKIFEETSDTDNTVPDTTTPEQAPSSDICTEITTEKEKKFLIQQGETDPCLTNTKEVDERDLTNEHISFFASTNTLCTITANSDELLPKHCGNFNSSHHVQTSFIGSLNKHIDTLNATNENLRNFWKNKFNQRNYMLPHDIEPEPEPEPEVSPTAMRDSFKEHSRSFSSDFSKSLVLKLKDMPKLNTLIISDLEDIITLGINNNTINNSKVGSFLHSLCGFWFSEFLSNESQYVTPELLLDGFKQSVKNTFYYKLRGVTRPNEEDSDDVMQSLRTELNEWEESYNNHLKEQNLTGQIDDLHKWANNQNDYRFNLQLPQNLYDKFHSLSQEAIFKNNTPSWVRKSIISSWLTDWFTDDDDENDNENTDKQFHLKHYLAEATKTLNTSPSSFSHIPRFTTDNHPIRKCIMNPTHFFGFEKKTIVGKLARKRYEEQGVQTTLTISEDFLMNTQRDQGGNQQTELNLSSTLSLLAIPLIAIGVAATGGLGLAGLIPAISSIGSLALTGAAAGTLIGFSGILGGANYSYRTYEGTGKRRLISLRVSEGVELISETTPITMHLENYHECLIIRPRFSAFEPDTKKYEHIWNTDNQAIKSIYKKLGILLCAKGKTPGKTITEEYHYIYPKYPINGITMDPSSHRNKPFAISLRGGKAYKKFIHNLSCYVTENKNQLAEKRECRDTRAKYEYLLRKNIEFAKNLKTGFNTPKMFHLTGESPGVYSRYTVADREIGDTTWSDDLLNYMSNMEWLDKEVENIVRDD